MDRGHCDQVLGEASSCHSIPGQFSEVNTIAQSKKPGLAGVGGGGKVEPRIQLGW